MNATNVISGIPCIITACHLQNEQERRIRSRRRWHDCERSRVVQFSGLGSSRRPVALVVV